MYIYLNKIQKVIEKINFKGKYYPQLQGEGFASQYAFPFAKKILSGNVIDIGCMKKEWSFPNSRPIDIDFNDGFDAMNLPLTDSNELWDGIFSSHCLEHLPNYVEALEYWNSMLLKGGVLFLYLPNCEYQSYWRAWHNKKHIHYLTPHLFKKYFEDNDDIWVNSIVTDGYDLNGSFYCIAQKI